jgi:type I restriction enzyme S subunit
VTAVLTVLLEELMAARQGSVDPSKHRDEVFDLYSIPAFDNGKPDVVLGSEIGSAKQVVEPGDVLLSRIVPHIRRAWVVGDNRGRRIIASGEWIVFRHNRVDSGYLRHVLVGDPFHTEFMHTVSGVGGSLLRARPAYVAKIRLPLPPLPEQRRIAEVLDRAESLRANRRAALARLDTLIRAIFLDMFGDPATNPKGFPTGTIGDLLESASYGTSEKAAAIGAFPVLRMNNITRTGEMDFTNLKYMELEVKQHERYLVRKGDILFNRTNSAELVGKTAIFRDSRSMAFAGYLIRMRVNEQTDPEYLAAFLNTAYSKRVLRGMCKSIIGMANINAQELRSIKIPRPAHPVQREFANRVTSIESLKATQRNSLALLDALFMSLQHRAFRGEL